ncbi:MAG TPA: methionine synthase [Candidatus Krumholzibacteria bacterium]|nr:methionine synthase [Candidatus Krumholzibacteria bacterium]HPD72341.1 methionine synthase [Candidatus Krumholzibacteria bacterium]HRY40727.1 methionine synthase [Candidatus Krumholzibacteria bacterium]
MNPVRMQLQAIADRRILVLDGAMGTMIQAARLDEADYRGALLRDHPCDVKGDNDLLCLTKPGLIADIHDAYLAAGADIVTTNTFNGTAISQREYGTTHLVRDLNLAAARLARAAADAWTARTPDRPRFAAGSIPPTNRTASLSPDVERPGLRNVTFGELAAAYREQVRALLDGGVQILLVETVFDTLNAKAALWAAAEELAARGQDVPVWVSGTITDRSGRTLSGQTPEAFWISVRHARPFAVGLNCALGAAQLRPHVAELARCADTLVSAYPNAGLPNELGGYDQTPGEMARLLGEFARDGLVNIVGGCCGTTPDFVAAIADAVAGVPPRRVPPASAGTALAGLEPLVIRDDSLLVNVGERTNVAGSRQFARLIREDRFEEALQVARQQVRGGAQMIDVNVDDPLLDGVAAMRRFLLLMASDPEVARVPVMIDSSRWEVLAAGLECLQGKCVVNSISLKEGEERFRDQARQVRRFGAAAVVMAFDERGQADTPARRREVCERAYRLLVDQEGWDPGDVILDANVFAVATGLPEHDRYALDYLETVRWIKANLPGCLTSGGISNLSFSFRGNATLREAMHAAFLYHAVAAGLDLAIVNAGRLPGYADLEPFLRDAVEDVILARRPDAAERLTALAQRFQGRAADHAEALAWRTQPIDGRLAYALVHGLDDFIEADTREALAELAEPLRVIEGPLMSGMNAVGDLFGAGKMFLPQVIRSARVMKRAVKVLEPALLAARQTGRSQGKILLATVKGDVHDIGKNIVGVVLGCNNYEVVDLGVMAPADRIIAAARREAADVIGLSGLITPSLDEMVHVAGELQREGFTTPLLIGGATTSRTHTAVRIDPAYAGAVVHVSDASRAPGVVGRLLDPATAAVFAAETKQAYAAVRADREQEQAARDLVPIADARAQALATDWSRYAPPRPRLPGLTVLPQLDLGLLRPFIDWTPFFQTWQLRGRYPEILERPQVGPEARRLLADAEALLDQLSADGSVEARGAAGIFPAASRGDDIVVYTGENRLAIRVILHHLRRQRADAANGGCPCLADLIAPEDSGVADWIGVFAVSAGFGVAELAACLARDGDDYRAILVKSLADRLAEAFAERLHWAVRHELWGYEPDAAPDNQALIREEYRGIRPAPGYPACPDHSEKVALFDLLEARDHLGVELTENWMMIPGASVCGWYFSHPQAAYFGVGRLGRDQVVDYAARKGWDLATAERWLAPQLAYRPAAKE